MNMSLLLWMSSLPFSHISNLPSHAFANTGDLKALPDKGQIVTDKFCAEAPLKELLEEVLSWVDRGEAMAPACKDMFSDLLQPIADNLRRHNNVRESAVEVFESLAKLANAELPLPTTGKAALAEFRAVSSATSPEESWLHLLLASRRSINKLATNAAFGYAGGFIAEASGVNGASPEAIVEKTSLDEVNRFAEELANNLQEQGPMGPMDDILQSAFQEALADLGTGARLRRPPWWGLRRCGGGFPGPLFCPGLV